MDCWFSGVRGAVGRRECSPAGQIFPPPPPVTACVAVVGRPTLNLTSQIWVPPMGNLLGFWRFNWNWTIQYACSPGNFSLCKLCYRFEIHRQNPNTGQWFVAQFGVVPGGSSDGGCDDILQVSSTLNWGAPVPAGTRMQTVIQAAAFDPTISSDCFGQDYHDIMTSEWVMPNDGS